jgi:hypothetical protein
MEGASSTPCRFFKDSSATIIWMSTQCISNGTLQFYSLLLALSQRSSSVSILHLCDWNYNAFVAHSVDFQDRGPVDSFIRKKYLYWLEALSLCKSMLEGVVSVAKLKA